MNQSEPGTVESLERSLTTVFMLHEQGNYDDAENLYVKLIDHFPTIWQLHFNYGLLLYELGRFQEALAAYQKGLNLEGANTDLLYNLALCQKQLGAYEDAVISYRNVLAGDPGDVDSHYNLAGCFRVMGEDMKAIEWYEKTLHIDAAHLSALNNLAFLYHKNDTPGRAAELYRRILDLDPAHARADHMLASIEGKKRRSAPDSYIRDVFDQFSDHYETSLINKLKYRLPAALLQFMKQSASASSFGRLLDLGCGTGLAGEVLKPFCNTMTGVDISEKMVAIAREKFLYDSLHIAEIQEFLGRTGPGAYDCIVAADVLPYVGDLKDLFARLAEIIAAHGNFFFSVETLHENKRLFKLQTSGRFSHTSTYIKELSSATGWRVMASENIDLRREKDGWIRGGLFGLIRE